MLAVNSVYTAHYSPLAERKSFLVKQFSNLGVTTEWFEMEPTSAEIEELYDNAPNSWVTRMNEMSYGDKFPPRQLRQAELSLAYKHFKMYEKIIEQQVQTTLILEDDVILDEEFIKKFNFNIFNTPRDYDFIFIGSGCNLRISESDRRPGQVAYLKTHPASKCTDSYVITYEAAEKIYESMQPFTFPIDFELNYQTLLHNMKVYWWEPPLVRQGSQCGLFGSEIQ